MTTIILLYEADKTTTAAVVLQNMVHVDCGHSKFKPPGDEIIPEPSILLQCSLSPPNPPYSTVFHTKVQSSPEL